MGDARLVAPGGSIRMDHRHNRPFAQPADRKSAPTREPNRCRLGEGKVPLAAIVRTLGQAGYRGDYEIELMGEEIETSDYGDLLAHCQQAYDDISAAAFKVPGPLRQDVA